MTEMSLYDRIGGREAVDRLVEVFYRRMDSEPGAAQIRAMHAADLGPLKTVLKDYLTEWLGGPKLFSPVHGHPRLRRRHGHLAIGQAERDAWMMCMDFALSAVLNDPEMRGQLRTALYDLADWMRNDAENPASLRAHRG